MDAEEPGPRAGLNGSSCRGVACYYVAELQVATEPPEKVVPVHVPPVVTTTAAGIPVEPAEIEMP
jgi:hypothetical protein